MSPERSVSFADPPPTLYLAWCAVWVLGLLALALWSLNKREI